MRIKNQLLFGLASAGLVAFFSAFSAPLHAGSESGKNPFSGDAKSVVAGKALYVANCADCHGASGKGDGKMASDLKKSPTDLTDSDTMSEDDAAIFHQISKARKPMPSYEKLLTPDERWHIVNYVKTLSVKK